MLRTILFAFFALSLTVIQAQDVPQAFKYQSIIRDANGDAVTNQSVGVRFYLIQNDNTVYAETHTATSNGLGLVNLNIGRGTVESGDFSMIDWGQATSMGIGVDITGGTNYEDLGAVELLSVPYAIHAGNGGGDDADADPMNELQTLSQDGANVTLSQDGGTVSVNDADADPANELQTLSQDGTNVTLSNNGGTISVNDGDSDATNEIELPTDAEAGDVAFFDGTSWVTVPDGQGGQMLTLNNSGTPYWSGPTTEGLLEATTALGQIIYVHPTVNSPNIFWNPAGTYQNLSGLPDEVVFPSFGNSLTNDPTGEDNTNALVTLYGDGNYAAKVCQDLEAFGFDDWYLPSTPEMEAIFQKFSISAGDGSLPNGYYWTSSYANQSSNAIFYRFGTGLSSPAANGNQANAVCVRK